MNTEERNSYHRIETESDIQDYLARLKYALKEPNTRIEFQRERNSDFEKESYR
jgi:hypothetical protein